MRFRAIEVLAGCVKTTLPPAPILKEDQLRVAVLLACATERVLPDRTADAEPDVTKPFTPVPQLVATHGTGNCGPAIERPLHCTSAHAARPEPKRINKDRSYRMRIIK